MSQVYQSRSKLKATSKIKVQRAANIQLVKNLAESLVSKDGRTFPYMLQNSQGKTHLLIGKKEAFIWSSLYTPRSITDIADRYFTRFQTVGDDFVIHVVNRWLQRGILTLANSNNTDKTSPKLSINFVGFDKWASTVYRYLGWFLGNNLVIYSIVGLSIGALLLYIPTSLTTFRPESTFSIIDNSLLFIIIGIISSLLHELGHVLMCKRFGVSIPQAGIRFIWGVPTLYLDLSGLWARPRQERVLISLAGVLVNLSIAGLAALAVVWEIAPDWRTIGEYFVLYNIISIVFNLLPFAKFDGYYILIDILDRPDLRESAFTGIFRHSKSKITWAYIIATVITSGLLCAYTVTWWLNLWGRLVPK